MYAQNTNAGISVKMELLEIEISVGTNKHQLAPVAINVQIDSIKAT